MTDKKKATQVAGTGTASKTANDSRHSTKTDPLIGLHALAANVKAAPAKRNWKRGRK